MNQLNQNLDSTIKTVENNHPTKKFKIPLSFIKNKSLEISNEKADIIAKSIPSLNTKKRIVVTGYTLIALLAFFSAIFVIFYMIAVSYSYVIGIGSRSNLTDFPSRLFFIFNTSLWNDFVLKNTPTFYSFFRNVQTNITSATSSDGLIFAISFYVSFYSLIAHFVFLIMLVVISIYQKILRNLFIAIFSLIPIIGTVLCIYYLGVLHFEHTFKYQKIFNKNNLKNVQDLNLKEQLTILEESITNIQNKSTPIIESDEKPSSDLNDLEQQKETNLKTEAFSYENPIGD
ncbi:hypothetical protein MCAV_05200 [[Mycoplasma] cavipharyngis]|uniref:hypothetical protein n=1 Tax=[Mycoplasma] cavipharyngis TaxID=92757 RepID=UPI003703809C